jgi:GNAT superfamily N-acetyltransferase
MRSYREGDEVGILELWKAVYPLTKYEPAKWLQWWQWMYEENPAGKGWIVLAEDKGKIVGQVALIPMLLKVGTDTIRCFHGIDTMTHPEYRHQGMYQRLARKAYAEAAKDGVSIGYGFANNAAYPIVVKKLGWIDMPSMQLRFKPFYWRNALKLKLRNKLLRTVLAIGASLAFNGLSVRTQKPPIVDGLQMILVSSFDERFDEFWTRICDRAPIMLIRNRTYLNWRYSPRGANYHIFAAEKDHQIYGYIILQHKMQNDVNTTTIFDLMFQSEEILQCLLSKAIEESRHRRTDVILYSSITENTFDRIFRKNGFICFSFIKNGHFNVYSTSNSVSKEFLSNSHEWLVQTGDSDAV